MDLISRARMLGGGAGRFARRMVSAARERMGDDGFAVLAALAVCAGGLYAFAGIVDEVLEGDTDPFDRAILMALRTAGDAAEPIGPRWLERVFMDLTALGGYALITAVAALAVGYLSILRRWHTLGLFVASLTGGTILNNLLKLIFDRPRPELVSHLVEVETLSLPSGHAMLSAIVYLTLAALIAQTQASRSLKIYVMGVGVALTLLVGVSRVYLGVHWPTDVLAGWCIGAAWAMAFWVLMQLLERGR